MGHQLSIEALSSFTFENILASSFGKTDHKQLVIRIRIENDNNIVNFIVNNKGESVLITDNLKIAIEKYNSL